MIRFMHSSVCVLAFSQQSAHFPYNFVTAGAPQEQVGLSSPESRQQYRAEASRDGKIINNAC